MSEPVLQGQTNPDRTLRAIVCCMRNEAAFVPEWVAYHLSIGFQRIFIITNNCQDGTDLMAKRLAEFEPVIHISNPVQPGQSPQTVGLALAMAHPAMAEVEWLLHIDADEFLNVTAGAGQIDDLLAVVGPCDAIAVSWRFMSSGGRPEWTGGSLLGEQTSTRASIENHLIFHKTICRPDRFATLTCHIPKDPVDRGVVLKTTAGMQQKNKSFFDPDDQIYWGVKDSNCTWENAAIHHHFVRSQDVFMLKNVRGDGMGYLHSNHRLGSRHWKHAERAEVQETSIQRHMPAVAARLATYEKDPTMKALQKGALDWLAEQRSLHLTAENLAIWDPRNLRHLAVNAEPVQLSLPAGAVPAPPVPADQRAAALVINTTLRKAAKPTPDTQMDRDTMPTESAIMPNAPVASAKGARTKRAVVCCMRNEAVFLPEWVAYHLSIGFDRIFLVTNGCQDGTDLMADRLALTQPLIHIRNPVQPGEPPQAIGLPYALNHPEMADVEWLLHIDADEFLNVTAGEGRVDDLIAAAGNCDCIAVAWRYIASGGRAEWTGGSLIAEQTMSIDRAEDQLQFHKSLFRPDQFGRITCHMPKEPVKAKPVLHNTAGTKLPLRGIIRHEKDTFSGIEPQDFTWANADIHHYFVRSADVFMLKNIRGDGMAYLHGNHILGSKLYTQAEREVVSDTTIQRHLPAVQALLAQYAADPVLKELMAGALVWLEKQRSQYFTAENLAVWDRRGRHNAGKVGRRLLRQNQQANL